MFKYMILSSACESRLSIWAIFVAIITMVRTDTTHPRGCQIPKVVQAPPSRRDRYSPLSHKRPPIILFCAFFPFPWILLLYFVGLV